MGFNTKEGCAALLVVISLAVLLAACGAPPTADVKEATATPDSEPDAPLASATPSSTPSPTPSPTPPPPAVTTQEPPPTDTPTPTPTAAAAIQITPTVLASRCEGLSGMLELQVLVGPAAAADMEPFAVGSAPFSVVASQPPYLVQGGGPIFYDDVATFAWGTYSVSLSMDTTISGECTGSGGSEALNLILEGTGEQMLVVDASGFHGEYPWSGTNSFELAFPLVEGASVQGEGYVFVLHLGQ
jgi:hypothetical protein